MNLFSLNRLLIKSFYLTKSYYLRVISVITRISPHKIKLFKIILILQIQSPAIPLEKVLLRSVLYEVIHKSQMARRTYHPIGALCPSSS